MKSPHSDDLTLIPVTGLLGTGISYSLSPMLHDAADQASGRMVDYHIFDVSPTGLDGFLSQVIQFGEVVGFNVTIPLKEIMYGRIDALHETAKGVGAINTVVVDGEHLIGWNTDRIAFASVVRATLDVREDQEKNWTAVILGAGGACRAIVHALFDLEIVTEIIIINRSDDRKFFMLLDIQEACDKKGVKLLQHNWLEWETIPIDSGKGKDSNENPAMLINATPLGGMDAGGKINRQSPVPSSDVLGRFSLVFDLVYNPPVTELMETARDAGLQAVGGGSMLIEQAVLSRAIWFGENKIEEERAAMVAAYSSWATKSAREK